MKSLYKGIIAAVRLFGPTGPTNPDFDKVVLQLHCDGANGGTSFYDSSQYHQSVSALSGATTSTTWKKFGSASASFDGSSMRLVAAGSHFSPGTQDFAVQMFVRLKSVQSGDRQLLNTVISVANGLSIGIQNGKPFAGPTGVTYGPIAPTSLVQDTDYFLEFIREAGTMYIKVNGSVVTSDSDSYNYTSEGYVTIGASYDGGYGPIDAYIDEVRFTIGQRSSMLGDSVPTDPFPDAGPPPGHSWWRWNITAGNSVVQLKNMEMYTTVGGADVCEGGTPFASDSFNSGYGPEKAFDTPGAGSGWASNVKPVQLGYHFASPVAIVEYGAQLASPSEQMSAWQFQWSDDTTDGVNGTWTTVNSQTAQSIADDTVHRYAI